MSISYNPNVPNPPNNPSSDVGDMHTNAASINTWVAVDHTGFNTGSVPSGLHKQVTIQDENVPVSKPADPTSVIYTDDGVADPLRPQLFWENSNSWSGVGPSLTAPFHLSAIRAWALISNGAIVAGQASNCTVSTPGSPVMQINLAANCVNSADYGVLSNIGSPLNRTTSSFQFITGLTQPYVVFVVLQI